MQVKIEIIDTINNDLIAAEQFSAEDSIVLSRKGGDDKIQTIVGSELLFSMLDETAADGRFLPLYTANEKQYKIVLTNYTTSAILWQGYLLPETYTEPYENGSIFINFSAVDGLGLLKGKYFEEDFYQNEQDVITILTNIFAETDLNLNFYFTPGIENTNEKDFSKVTIDMLNYFDVENQKYDSMYVVLEDLMISLISVCFQQNNVWNIVGLNHRYLENYKAKEYTSAGVFVAEKTVTREIVVGNPLVTPIINIDPPLKAVKVFHKLNKFNFPDTLVKEELESVVSLINIQKLRYATAWQQHNNIKPYVFIDSSEIYVPIISAAGTSFDDTRYFNLREKAYVRAGSKLKFEFEIKMTEMATVEDLQTELDKNLFVYELLLNDTIILSNRMLSSGLLQAKTKDTARVLFHFIAAQNGYIDLKIYDPLYEFDGVFQEYIFKKLDLINLSEIAEEDFAVNNVAESYSIELNYEVPISDDITGLTKCFSLDKKRIVDTVYDTETITVDYSFIQNGKFYSVVQLYWLQMIDQNRTEVYNGATNVVINDVIYNYNNGEQMVFETNSLIAGATTLTVRVKPYVVPTGNYNYYETWTDSLYALESNKLVQAAANVLQRLYAVPSLRVDATFQKSIDFNTLVNFNYLSGKNYVVANSSWNITKNETTVTMIEGLYDGLSMYDRKPIVDAGALVNIADAATTANLSATAVDTDGFIETILWEQTTPVTPLATISNAAILNPALSNLTEDDYVFKITVTDDKGFTASDTVGVIRDKIYAIKLTKTFEVIYEKDGNKSVKQTYTLETTPELNTSDLLLLNANGLIALRGWVAGAVYGSIIIKKNGATIHVNANSLKSGDTDWGGTVVTSDIDVQFSFISSDAITIELFSEYIKGNAISPKDIDVKFAIESVEFTGSSSTSTTLPLIVENNLAI